MNKFLNKMVDLGRIETFRITRMKLGFRSMDLPEFRIDMEFKNMQQLDDAMTSVIRNEENKGCAIAWNQGIRRSTGEYVCIVNNDIEVPFDWLYRWRPGHFGNQWRDWYLPAFGFFGFGVLRNQ